MYALKKLAILVYNYIKTNIKPHSYHPVISTVGLWKHESRPIYFCLYVDGFGIK